MKNMMASWREYMDESRLDEAISKIEAKRRKREKREKELSSKIISSMGMSETERNGDTELDRLGRGITEEESVEESGNPYHRPDGRFGGPEKGNIYSISKDGAKRLGIDQSYAKKGRVTGNRDKKGKPKLSYRYTMASGPKACGRVDVQRGPIPYKRSCKDYPAEVSESVDMDECPVDGEVSTAYVRGVIQQEIKKAVRDIANIIVRSKRNGGKVTLDQMVPAIRTLALSLKGKSPETPKA